MRDNDRDYILGSLRLVFPTIDVSVDQVVYSFSGIRPLARSDHHITGRMSPAGISCSESMRRFHISA